VHDLLYENQQHLETTDLVGYAQQLGLDVERFERELEQGTHAARVHEDFMSGVRSGVNGTPSFYVNGALYEDAYDVDALLAALRRA
jgi:protein-disulfide isomerase